jgi:hypothetical protein
LLAFSIRRCGIHSLRQNQGFTVLSAGSIPRTT